MPDNREFVCQNCGKVQESPEITETDSIKVNYTTPKKKINEEIQGTIKYWRCILCNYIHVISKSENLEQREEKLGVELV